MLLGARRRHQLPPAASPPLPSNETLVSVPTYDGSGDSIHPSVVDMGGLWNGYRWWFADTPYENENDQLENPTIYASNNRAVWEVPAGLTNPLVGPPAGGYHSDVELVWDPDGHRLVLYWRDYVPTRTPKMYLRTMHSTDGVTWHESAQQVMNDWEFSPTVWRAGPGDWRQWRFGYVQPPVMWTAPTALGPWTFAATCNMGGVYNWHGDIIRHQGRWIGIYSDKTAAYPMASTDDGVTWTTGPALGITSYRPTFCPSTEAGQMDIWSSRMGQMVHYYRRSETLWLGL